MQKRHTDRESYFDEQSQTSKNYYIPYIKEVIGHIPDKVLEVGCGEGGNRASQDLVHPKASAGTVHCHRHFPA